MTGGKARRCTVGLPLVVAGGLCLLASCMPEAHYVVPPDPYSGPTEHDERETDDDTNNGQTETNDDADHASVRADQQLLGLRRACLRTGGAWHRGLVQCRCAGQAELFFADRGCQTVDLSPFEWQTTEHPEYAYVDHYLVGGLRGSKLDVEIDGRDTSRDLRAKISDALAKDPALILRGLVIPAADAPSRRVAVAPLTRMRFGKYYNTVIRHHTLAPLTEYRSFEAILEPARETLTVAQCAAAVTDGLDLPHEQANAADTCGRLLRAWQQMQNPLRDDYEWSDTGESCGQMCGWAKLYSDSGWGTLSFVAMRDYVPVARMIRAFGPSGHIVTAMIAATGEIEALKWHWSRWSTPRPDEARYEWRSVWLNNHLQPIDRARGASDTPIARQQADRTLRLAGRGEGLRALLLETGFTPDHPMVWPQLNLAACATLAAEASWWTVGGQVHKDSVWGVGLAEAVQNADSLHADAVAEILIRDLPGVELAGMEGTASFVRGDTQDSTQEVIAAIRRYRPAVVNISRLYSSSPTIESCEASIGRVFAALPDVLFSVAVGNDSQRDGVGTCPSILWRTHPNVVTVAATDEGRRLAWFSNHGPKVAMVAAMGVATVTAGAGAEAHEVITDGTSMAAPYVGNLALKMLARNPGMTPPEIIAALMANCDDSGLDVACGGAITEQALVDAGLLP